MKAVKIGCIVVFFAFGVFSLATNNRLLVTTVLSYPGGPPPGVTGAPGETTCIACHSGDPGAGTFTIVAPPNYAPGQSYQIQVRHQTADSTRRRWGFEITALSGLSSAGIFADLSSLTQTFGDSNRQYVSHTQIGTFQDQPGGAQWTFQWTAPPTNVGTVTFYAAGNQANNDGASTGDQIYVTSTSTNPVGGEPTPTPSPVPTPTPTPTPSPSPTPTPSPTPSPSPTPTPATSGTVTGRVLTPNLIGVRNAVVTLVDSLNNRRTTTTSSFGVYTFASVNFNEMYTLTVTSKRYRFTPNVFTLTSNVTIDLVGLE